MSSLQFDKIIKEASKEAHKSPMRNKHGCLIMSGNEIISRGHNYYKFNRMCDNTEDHRKGCTIHAEIDAINNCKDKSQLNGAIVVVIRINRMDNNSVMYSAPCDNCKKILIKMMRKYKLSKVLYSTDMILE